MSNMLDMITVGIFFIIFCMASIVGFFVFTNLTADTSLIPANIASGAGDFYKSMNNVAIFIMIGMLVGAMLSAYMIKTNPVYIIVPVAFIFIQVVVIVPLINAFNGFADSSTFAASAAAMDEMVSLVNAMPLFTIVGSLVAAVVGLSRE